MKSFITQNDGDYIKDEVLYCGKCDTPKQIKINMGDTIIKPYCLCKCEQEREKEEQIKRDIYDFEVRVNKLRAEGFPQSEMNKWTFEKDDHANEKVTEIAKNYVKHFDEMKKRGKGLLLFGDVGTGKTFTAACIVNALIDLGHPCLMTNFSRLINTIGGMYEGKQEYIDDLNRFDLMVLDDLATERDTEYMNEHVHNIIDSRYRAGLPTIITTNLSSKELYSPDGIHKKRTYSRILEMTIPIKVDGVDRRKQKLKDDLQELHGLLGL